MTNSQILNYILHNLRSLNESTVFQKVIPMITVDYCESSMHIVCLHMLQKIFLVRKHIFRKSEARILTLYESILVTTHSDKDPLKILIWFLFGFLRDQFSILVCMNFDQLLHRFSYMWSFNDVKKIISKFLVVILMPQR